MPVRTQAKSVGFGSDAQRRGLAMNAARGRSTRGARGFEVVAMAISEVRQIQHTPVTRARSKNPGRDRAFRAHRVAGRATARNRSSPKP
jgi:hypothetical protein